MKVNHCWIVERSEDGVKFLPYSSISPARTKAGGKNNGTYIVNSTKAMK